jgi:formylmethanofuran dehydrogenase subunit C
MWLFQVRLWLRRRCRKISVILRPKYLFKIPVEAECISPDQFIGKSLNEISELQLWEGNKQRNLSDLFDIEGNVDGTEPPEKFTIQLLGDVSRVRRIGTGMTKGEVLIHRDSGTHLGEEMKGGKITVGGNADSWTGAMMKNGLIEIKGDAGDYVGSAYRGSIKGMKGGAIIIHGNVGSELGLFMAKGLIKVDGNAGSFVGMHMKDGTIYVKGNSAGRAGAQMTGGKIVVGGNIPSVLPTFSIESIKSKVKVDTEEAKGPFYLFVGDRTEEGDGKLYISQVNNQHLKFYEQFL